MTEVQEILANGRSFRDETRAPCSRGEIGEFESRLGVILPRDYREFLLLGGLGELNFDQQFLSFSEIESSREWVPSEYLPFASNGCGDSYCWRVADLPNSAVYFFEHESRQVQVAAESFCQVLRKWRRR